MLYNLKIGCLNPARTYVRPNLSLRDKMEHAGAVGDQFYSSALGPLVEECALHDLKLNERWTIARPNGVPPLGNMFYSYCITLHGEKKLSELFIWCNFNSFRGTTLWVLFCYQSMGPLSIASKAKMQTATCLNMNAASEQQHRRPDWGRKFGEQGKTTAKWRRLRKWLILPTFDTMFIYF